jgi:diguanylate cyclase (GGDEF)-like protein
MNRPLRTIRNLLAHIFEISYRNLRGIDYKALNQHILSIHQLRDIDSILYKSSRCLKDILDYQLFAFAMCDDAAVDIWLDPKFQSNKVAILNIIKDDLEVTGGSCTLHHFDDDEIPVKKKRIEVRLEDLLSYRVIDTDFKARLYIVPNRNITHYHNDVIEMMMKVVGTSLSHCMRVKRLQQNVMIDPLTLCYNKRALDEFVDQTIDSTRRYGNDLSAIMFDLDHFKNINDTYGHQAGDIVLKAVSRTILSTIRKCDYLIRYGGEEFVLIMPATKLSKAVDVADRLRRIIENLIIPNNGTTIRVTASFGVADLKKDYNKHHLLRDADRRLYDAKAKGRNRIVPDLRLFDFENTPVPDIAYQYLN